MTAAGLPTQGLLEAPTIVLTAVDGGDIVGWIALERHGDDGLLRSLLVDGAHRGLGVGVSLVNAIEGEAVAQGLRSVYLLTETAESFFARRGYRRVPRDAAPETVKASVEWAVACSDAAIPMVKDLPRTV